MVIKKTKTIIVIAIVLFVILMTENANAATAQHNGHEVFSAAVEGQGVLVALGVDCRLSVEYDNSSVPYKATKLGSLAYIHPARSGGISNGFVDASITETVDFSSNTTTRHIMRPPASYWIESSGIFPSPSHIYFNLYCTMNQDFYYSLEEKGYFFFTYPGANLYYKRSYTGTLNIGTPK